MIALAGDFDIFAPRIMARLAAVLLAVRNIVVAWNVRPFLVLLVCHGNSSDRYFLDSQFSAALNAAVLMQGRPTACRVGMSAGAVFLCNLIAIKIPSGGDKQLWCY
jgi:hypothetical protein